MEANKKIPGRIMIAVILTALVGGFCLFAAHSGRGKNIAQPPPAEKNKPLGNAQETDKPGNSIDLVRPAFLDNK